MTEPFFPFEGGEGSGKSTQIQMLRERFSELFPGVGMPVFTREPGGTPVAEATRGVILSPEARDMSALTAFYLFAAARNDHIENVIRPGLDAGKVVFSDRFVGSTFAYQACAMKNPISQDRFRTYFEELAAKPALPLIFDIDPEIGSARVGRDLVRVQNHFDTRSFDFHERVREGYLALERYTPTRIIDASRGKEEIFEEVVACLREHLQ